MSWCRSTRSSTPSWPARIAGQAIDAGLVIHEGQLTYARQNLARSSTAPWWHEQTGLPLPLGANALRKDLGLPAICEVQRLLRASIEYGLAIAAKCLTMPSVSAAGSTATRPTNLWACT